MKEVIEYSVPVQHRVFICEVCGKRSYYKEDIEVCEASHFCKHFNIEYRLEEGESCYCFESLSENCLDCGKELGEVRFEDFEERQEILRKIYEVMHIKRKDD